jgi:hypothetical protein
MDARGIPTSECPECGSNLIRLVATFDDNYEISMYGLEAECYCCETLLTAPTPLDIIDA